VCSCSCSPAGEDFISDYHMDATHLRRSPSDHERLSPVSQLLLSSRPGLLQRHLAALRPQAQGGGGAGTVPCCSDLGAAPPASVCGCGSDCAVYSAQSEPMDAVSSAAATDALALPPAGTAATTTAVAGGGGGGGGGGSGGSSCCACASCFGSDALDEEVHQELQQADDLCAHRPLSLVIPPPAIRGATLGGEPIVPAGALTPVPSRRPLRRHASMAPSSLLHAGSGSSSERQTALRMEGEHEPLFRSHDAFSLREKRRQEAMTRGDGTLDGGLDSELERAHVAAAESSLPSPLPPGQMPRRPSRLHLDHIGERSPGALERSATPSPGRVGAVAARIGSSTSSSAACVRASSLSQQRYTASDYDSPG
jgi:hypothetical protein